MTSLIHHVIFSESQGRGWKVIAMKEGSQNQGL